MSIVNRRNAFVGWLALKVGKRVARRKVRSAAEAWGPAPRHRRKLLTR